MIPGGVRVGGEGTPRGGETGGAAIGEGWGASVGWCLEGHGCLVVGEGPVVVRVGVVVWGYEEVVGSVVAWWVVVGEGGGVVGWGEGGGVVGWREGGCVMGWREGGRVVEWLAIRLGGWGIHPQN